MLTVVAATVYSRTKSQPIIQAINSPIVACNYVSLPANRNHQQTLHNKVAKQHPIAAMANESVMAGPVYPAATVPSY